MNISGVEETITINIDGLGFEIRVVNTCKVPNDIKSLFSATIWLIDEYFTVYEDAQGLNSKIPIGVVFNDGSIKVEMNKGGIGLYSRIILYSVPVMNRQSDAITLLAMIEEFVHGVYGISDEIEAKTIATEIASPILGNIGINKSSEHYDIPETLRNRTELWQWPTEAPQIPLPD